MCMLLLPLLLLPLLLLPSAEYAQLTTETAGTGGPGGGGGGGGGATDLQARRAILLTLDSSQLHNLCSSYLLSSPKSSKY